MPSSLMARAKAGQSGSSPSPSVAAAPKKLSSLAAAASASSSAGRQTNNRGKYYISTNKSTYEPSYKLNPMNVAASIKVDGNKNDVNDVVKKVTETAGDKQQVASSSAPNDTKTNASSPSDKPVEKSLIQQLLQNQTKETFSKRIRPAEYVMCSQSEALDRQTHMELSPFECYPSSLSGITTKISTASASTHNDEATFSSPQCSSKFTANNCVARRNRPKYHAQYVVKKYRRSAAGGGTLSEISEANIRTLEQLNESVDYLINDLFVWQMPPPMITIDVGASVSRSGDDPNEISIWEDDDPDELSKQEHEQHSPFSLSDTVAFVDDRLRAVQKDLVTLLGNVDQNAYSIGSNDPNSITAKRLYRKHLNLKQTVRKMQAKMVRYNILTSYLLSGVPASKYEVKFGARALRTSLSCYLDLSSTLGDEYYYGTHNLSPEYRSQYKEECQTKDEMMAYMALLHSSAVIRSEEKALPPPSAGEVTSSLIEESGSGWGALLSTFCKHVVGGGTHGMKGSSTLVECYPRWKWALTLACLAQEGNFQGYFKLLEKGPSVKMLSSNVFTKEETASNARFLLLARCCASHSLNLIRLGQLRRYNNSFGKGEKVSGKDLARLLRINDKSGENSAKLAIDFCRDAGLPIVEKVVDYSNELHVAMKSAPIKISKDGAIKRICNPGRVNDSFVFGSSFGDDISRRVDSLTDQLNECAIVEDWEANSDADDGNLLSNHIDSMKARVDEDEVLIPSSQAIWALME